MTLAFPFIVRQTTGPSRQITLLGRSLPYQNVSWGGTQRVNINYFPGNPVANSQVIGQTYKPTVVRGTWKDTFLLLQGTDPNRNAPRLVNFPRIGVPGLPTAAAITPGGVEAGGGRTFPSAGSIPAEQICNRARAARDAFELMRREGQLLRVEWGSIVRFGYLTDANYSHAREEDIEWELEFTWTGDTDAQPRIRFEPKLEPLGLLKELVKQLQALIDELNRGLAEALTAVKRLQQNITLVGTLVTNLLETLEKFATLALVPLEVIGNVRQQFTAIALAAKDLIDTVRSTPPALVSGIAGEGVAAGNTATAIADAIARNASILGAGAITQRRELESLADSALLGVFVAPGSVTLRDVALRFYGNPSAWPKIQEFNNLATSIVPRGTVIRVPRIQGQF